VIRALTVVHQLTVGWPQRPGFASARDLLVADRGGDIRLDAMPPPAVRAVRQAWQPILTGAECAIHGDAGAGNVLVADDRVTLLDWDESRTDVPWFDFAFLPATAAAPVPVPMDALVTAGVTGGSHYHRFMRVDQLWRYPVKSVGGEQLAAATVGSLGVEGDRTVVVRNERDEVTWAGEIPALMQLRAVTVAPGAIDVVLPDGDRFRTDAPDADDRLSAAVQAKVTLTGRRPDQPGATLHLVTTTTLRSLSVALPDSVIDPTRFRPNLVLDDAVDDGTGHPEHGWIGRRLAIGAVRLRFTEGCDRCVMITKETPTVPHDRAVLRWVAREVGNTLGVYAAVEASGPVHVGDEARWLD
jgi:uncharacterized protein YcbX